MKRIILALITATFLLASCVKQNPQVVLQKISISPDTLHIAVGSTQKLNPVFTPSTFSTIAVEWESTDESVASFTSAGYLSAKKTGKTWVTVKDKNSATAGRCYIIVP